MDLKKLWNVSIDNVKPKSSDLFIKKIRRFAIKGRTILLKRSDDKYNFVRPFFKRGLTTLFRGRTRATGRAEDRADGGARHADRRGRAREARPEPDASSATTSASPTIRAIARGHPCSRRETCSMWTSATGSCRWYDAATGRWISKDPILLDGGLNLYAFCEGNPICSGESVSLFGCSLFPKSCEGKETDARIAREEF